MVLEEKIDIRNHKEFSKMNETINIPLKNIKITDPQLHIRLQYNYSEIQRFDFLLLQKDEEIKELIFSVTEIENYIDLLSSPFTCFLQNAGKIVIDPEDLNQEKIGDHKYYQ